MFCINFPPPFSLQHIHHRRRTSTFLSIFSPTKTLPTLYHLHPPNHTMEKRSKEPTLRGDSHGNNHYIYTTFLSSKHTFTRILLRRKGSVRVKGDTLCPKTWRRLEWLGIFFWLLLNHGRTRVCLKRKSEPPLACTLEHGTFEGKRDHNHHFEFKLVFLSLKGFNHKSNDHTWLCHLSHVMQHYDQALLRNINII